MIMVLVKFIKNIMNKKPKDESIQVNPDPSAAIGSMIVKLAPVLTLAIGAIGIMMCIVLFFAWMVSSIQNNKSTSLDTGKELKFE